MFQTVRVVIKDHHFNNGLPVRIRAGDAVVWVNEGGDRHTATSPPGSALEFDTGVLQPGQESEPIPFPIPSDHSGFAYACRFHPDLEGRIIALPPAAPGEGSYSPASWRQIAQIVAANWVYDLADDFAHALESLSDKDLDRVRQAWTAVEGWWHEQAGPQPILDREVLSGQPRERLEHLGRTLRTAYRAVRPLVVRHPNPSPSESGQSEDAIGDALAIFNAPEPVQQAYLHEMTYVSLAFRIECALDAGLPVSEEQLAAYHAAKETLSPADYLLLAEHQIGRLQALFGSAEFDPSKFAEGVWRMTLAGAWDDPPFALWHWLRWIDAYLGVVETGQVPDLVPLRRRWTAPQVGPIAAAPAQVADVVPPKVAG